MMYGTKQFVAGGMVAVAAMVVFSAVEAQAASNLTLLSDDFTSTGTPDPTDLNYNLAARQAGSSLGTVSLFNQSGGTEVDGNVLDLTGGWGVAGFEHNFATDANAVDSPLTIEWDMSPNTGGGAWTALDIGPFASPFLDFVQPGVPLGIAFELNGLAEVRSPGNISHGKTDLGTVLAAGEIGHYVVVISGQSGTGSGFDSDGFLVTAQLNGGAVTTLYSSATALPSGGISFVSQNGFIDNLTVSIIPEPASIALMGLGGLMMLRRRRA